MGGIKMFQSGVSSFIILLFGLFIVLVACSSDDQGAATEPDNNVEGKEEPDNTESPENSGEANTEEDFEEVTLLMVTHGSDEQFEHNFKSHLEDKYPHMTLEHIQSRHDELEENGSAKNLEPDLMMTSASNYLL